MAFSLRTGMNLCLGRGTLDSDMYMEVGFFGHVEVDMDNIFNTPVNEMPDCKDISPQ